jgi:hypothetical protein
MLDLYLNFIIFVDIINHFIIELMTYYDEKNLH